jgi:transcriptional regulator with XRE-family HTH domain
MNVNAHVRNISAESTNTQRATMSPRMKTLRERCEWVLRARGFNSMRDLCARANVARSALTGAFEREATKGKHSMRIDTIRALASTANVSPYWLETGEGGPDDREVTAPIRASTVALARSSLGPAQPGHDMLRDAQDAVQELARDGVQVARAQEIVGALLLRRPELTGIGLYRAATEALEKAKKQK